ncbi:histidine kinase [Colwellia sp. 75C3]|uniref:ATP-binding protein n=1 Tax=Colwellia sp. 75C3 TaxID=888425 RepID=UPI000C32CFED|nr:ATP-binding protein [Colwellia sp. 75C3]PKG82393.1 histidine kinase [Colwellia sp. 75C3]
MQIAIRQLILALTGLILFIPYQLIASWLSTSPELVSNVALFSLQIFSGIVLYFCYKKKTSRSFKLFWQYLLLAILVVITSKFLNGAPASISQHLYQDFASLFIYFFILLAIETNPHLSNLPLKKYINGQVPAVFFTLICFCYFILLPAGFSQEIYQTSKPSLLFHLVINTLILVKLILCLFSCKDNLWRYTFALLSLSASFLLIGNTNTYLDNSILKNTHSYYAQLIYLLPYFLLILTANITLKSRKLPKAIEKENSPELSILLLMIIPIVIHLYGYEQKLFYNINSNLQSIIILFWLFVGSILLSSIAITRRSHSNKLKKSLFTEKNKHQQLTSLNDDLTDALINSEDKAIVSASNNAILTTTIKGEILSANPAAVQMFQSIEQELKGISVSNLFAEKDEMHFFFDFQSNIYSLQRKNLGISVECISLRSDGTEFPAQAELQFAQRATQPLIVITFINLSERKNAEKQALELKDKFIANISHEFRTPLTIINGIIDRYITKTSDELESEELTTAKRNGLRLVRMVEQLLELSRLSDNPQLSLSTYRLNTLMMMPVDSFSRLASQSHLTFSSNIPDDLWLDCDGQAFEKIIFNLLANAIKYTPKGGSVQVNAYAEQDTIIVDIIDSGIGINKASQGKIFERFQRADDVKNQATFGVGIGLSLVNELVKAHGWRITLVSEQGHGSKFSLSMPLASAKDIETEIEISISENEVTSLLTEQRSATSNQANHSQQVVLVIEDNLDMQSHIKQVIEQQHHCILAGSGELGLQLAQEYIPDLIVCDLMLTGIDGFEVLTQLKQDEMTAHIPVILLTARSDLESRLQGLKLNADEYLSKPFNQHELLTRIQNLIANRQQLQKRYLQQFNDDKKAERKTTSQKNVAKLTQETIEESSLEDKFLHKLEALIAKHYTEPELDISLLAKELAVSERQLQRKIKVILGTTPNNFIKEFRLKKAQELLMSGSQIGRIALDVGFSSQTYFGRCFKESYHCTPKQYQQKMAQEDSTPD